MVTLGLVLSGLDTVEGGSCILFNILNWSFLCVYPIFFFKFTITAGGYPPTVVLGAVVVLIGTLLAAATNVVDELAIAHK